MSKRTQGKRVFWRGRTRDSELFTSSLKSQIPNIISVNLSGSKVIACEVELPYLANRHLTLEGRRADYVKTSAAKEPTLKFRLSKGGE